MNKSLCLTKLKALIVGPIAMLLSLNLYSASSLDGPGACSGSYLLKADARDLLLVKESLPEVLDAFTKGNSSLAKDWRQLSESDFIKILTDYSQILDLLMVGIGGRSDYRRQAVYSKIVSLESQLQKVFAFGLSSKHESLIIDLQKFFYDRRELIREQQNVFSGPSRANSLYGEMDRAGSISR
ncbi:MAG: hypothetical protein AB8E15_08120 [Bdellovibrionales bacterium]